jgi:signal transduction histidine kinase
VQADPIQLAHVIDGLLSNAIKFSPPGGQVTVRVDRLEGAPHLSVRDTAAGIESRHLQRIFESGYRPGGVQVRRFGGLGISLSLIKELITAYGGKIWAESQPGRGTTFHFTLLQPK